MPQPRGQILVIDEHPEDMETLSTVLNAKGYEVTYASTGDDGIRIAEAQEPDLIFLDLELTTIRALDVCRNLRLRNTTWSIPIILITETGVSEADVVRGLDMGANDCVSRPFRQAELLGRVGVLMRMKRVEDKLRRLYLERTRELEWSNMELQKIRTQLILKSQMSTLGLLVAVAAHEIRSPASSISGNLEQLGDLIRNFLIELSRFQSLVRFEEPEEIERISTLMVQLAELNLRNSPLDVPGRRKQIQLLERYVDENAAFVPNEELLERLAKFRLGDHLPVLLDLLETHGAEVLNPILILCDLIVKFKNMQISIERINAIVKTMKGYSHIDRAELQELDIHSGLEDTLMIMNYIFRGTVEIIKNFSSELPRPLGYPGELNQVWTNLLQNAFDAMEQQPRRITLSTATQVLRGVPFVSVAITDTGKGIPPELLPHIFESFFTTKEKGKGSGLGLDICKQIVEKHGGQIRVESIPGETTFTVLLPVEQRREINKNHPARTIDFDTKTESRGDA